jgi:hypothetical protein
MCAGSAVSAGGLKRVFNPNTSNTYVLNSRGCAPIAQADVRYFAGQGYMVNAPSASTVTSGIASNFTAVVPAGAFTRTMQSVRKYFLTSSDFGFVCDGSTDNVAAFAHGLTQAVATGVDFRITADHVGGTLCDFKSLTTITSPGSNSLGQPPSLQVYIDPGVTVLFNGSTGWLTINGVAAGGFRHSGVIGGNISADPAQAAGSAYALSLEYVNEAIVRDVAFFNLLTGTGSAPSYGLLLKNVYAADIFSNFFANHGIGVNLVAGSAGPTNYAKVCNNEFGSATVVAINSGGSSGKYNTANVFCNNYFEQNNTHISIGQYETNFQIVGNYLNQGGCVQPCWSPSPYNGSDITIQGINGIISGNSIVNSTDNQNISIMSTAARNQITQNYAMNNSGAGVASIVLASGSVSNIVQNNNLTGTLPGPNLPISASGTGNQIGLNYYDQAANGTSNTTPVIQGGTGDTGTAWTHTTPTVTCDVGTPTTVTADVYTKTLGKTTWLTATLTLTNIGACTTYAIIPLPNTSAQNATFTATDISSGTVIVARAEVGGTRMLVYAPGYTFPPQGDTVTVSGVYTNQ